MSSEKSLILENDPLYIPLEERCDPSVANYDGKIVCEGSAYLSKSDLRFMRLYPYRWKMGSAAFIAVGLVGLVYLIFARTLDYTYTLLASLGCLLLMVAVNILPLRLIKKSESRFNRLLWTFSDGHVIYSRNVLYEDLENCKTNDLATSMIRGALIKRFSGRSNHEYVLRLLSNLGCDISELDRNALLAQEEARPGDERKVRLEVFEELDRFLDLLTMHLNTGLSDPTYRDDTVRLMALLHQLSVIEEGEDAADQRFSILSDLISDGQSTDKVAIN